MWCYSFPCTDISMAGQMKGMSRDADTQSSLLWEIERLIESTKDKPKYLIMENVPTLAGNSVVVPVLKEIFRTLFIDKCEVDLDYYKQLKMF